MDEFDFRDQLNEIKHRLHEANSRLNLLETLLRKLLATNILTQNYPVVQGQSDELQ